MSIGASATTPRAPRWMAVIHGSATSVAVIKSQGKGYSKCRSADVHLKTDLPNPYATLKFLPNIWGSSDVALPVFVVVFFTSFKCRTDSCIHTSHPAPFMLLRVPSKSWNKLEAYSNCSSKTDASIFDIKQKNLMFIIWHSIFTTCYYDSREK